MDARAIIAHFAAQHSGTVSRIVDEAIEAVAGVIAGYGLEGRIDDGGTFRAAVTNVVVNRFRDFVVERLVETRQNPELLEGRSERDALIYLLSDHRHD